jgi:alanine racemase
MTDIPDRTLAYVDEEALRANLRRVRSSVAADVAVLAVVKADGYGHTASVVAPVLDSAGVDWFGVATVEEGAELRALGIRRPILVLYGIDPRHAERARRLDLAVAVVDAATLPALAAAASGLRVHLEVDTGMTRLGVRPSEVAAAAAAIGAAPGLELDGVFSHFGNADDARTPHSESQVQTFRDAVATLDASGMRPRWVHLCNSAGTLMRPDAHFGMVRPGVCLYGVTPAAAGDVGLRPAMRLESRVWRVWEVPAGRHVGYDQTYVTSRPTRIAVVPVGYADGYPRALSNRGEMLVGGHRAPIIGRVCMDVTMIDVTDIAGVVVGNPVILWGASDAGALPVDEVAVACDTIAYELLTRVGRRVPKVLVPTNGLEEAV